MENRDESVQLALKSVLDINHSEHYKISVLKELWTKGWYAGIHNTNCKTKWILLEDGCEMPDYDELVAWYREDGFMFFEMLDKEGNLWENPDTKVVTYFGQSVRVTHWARIPSPCEKESQQITSVNSLLFKAEITRGNIDAEIFFDETGLPTEIIINILKDKILVFNYSNLIQIK